MTPLTEMEIERHLEEMAGWTYREGGLHREYRFKNFVEAFAFMTACALEAEKMNHHPDWSNAWAKVQVRLRTHDAGAVTSLDMELAKRMEAQFRARGN
ncbi:MAG: 4a-hydroxytetrahydrobiopterin dehydratase [Blastochloris sp.]|nr:4a-hydroxytetrahydrobiopterin dehydratase [Blastochloris sp.]